MTSSWNETIENQLQKKRPYRRNYSGANLSACSNKYADDNGMSIINAQVPEKLIQSCQVLTD